MYIQMQLYIHMHTQMYIKCIKPYLYIYTCVAVWLHRYVDTWICAMGPHPRVLSHLLATPLGPDASKLETIISTSRGYVH